MARAMHVWPGPKVVWSAAEHVGPAADFHSPTMAPLVQGVKVFTLLALFLKLLSTKS
jgi:hypothetical protein